MGRSGEYYKNKYGRGRSNREEISKSRNKRERSRSRDQIARGKVQDWSNLKSTMVDLDGKSYGAYNSICKRSFQHVSPDFVLTAVSIQSDAYAAPSSFCVIVDSSSVRLPSELIESKARRICVGDFFARKFIHAAQACDANIPKKGNGWHGTKGGDISMDNPTQHVLERTNVIVHENGAVEARFTVGLPARGRSICGYLAKSVLCEVLPSLLAQSLSVSTDMEMLYKHVYSVEDQIALRGMLASNGLVGFIRNGAILPRENGDVDTPLQPESAQAFQAPPSLSCDFTLPHSGKITGMGIPRGITLIVGGGYHGKSTLLQALDVGMYNHIPGDGREFVVVDPFAVRIRAEDGRSVASCDVSPFLSNLPFDQSTLNFSTANASGSTSQAANIMEAIEAGATTLMMDEDTCATNFMIRDRKMQQLVARNKEPITPYISKAEAMYKTLGVSSILVIGGSGAYFSIANTVIMMDSFQPQDVTFKAKEIASQHEAIQVDEIFRSNPSIPRIPVGKGFQLDGRIRYNGLQTIQYGELNVDISALNHIIETGQVYAIAQLLHRNLAIKMDGKTTLKELLDRIEMELDENLDSIDGNDSGERCCGRYTRPRTFEIAAVLNRIRTASFVLKE